MTTRAQLALKWFDRCLEHLDNCGKRDCDLYYYFSNFLYDEETQSEQRVEELKRDAKERMGNDG